MRVLVLFLVLAGLLWQCKLHRVGDSEERSLRAADDALKVAVNYIGDMACSHYWKDNEAKSTEVIAYNKSKARQIVTHMLNGPNGELISDEYRASAARRKHLLLSGDLFFDKMRSKDSSLDMQTIADNCRRLVLSVDSDNPPTITFAKGFAIHDQKQELNMMNVDGRFGTLECLADQPFCSFGCIADSNAVCAPNKRYFVLVWPDKKTQQVKANVTWKKAGKEDYGTITIPHLTYTGNAPARWRETVPTSPAATELHNKKVADTKPSVFTVAGLAELTVSEAKRIDGQHNEAEITLQFTALKDIVPVPATFLRKTRKAVVSVASVNAFKFAVDPSGFSIPSQLRAGNDNFYAGNKFFDMRVLSRWGKGTKLTIQYRVKLQTQGSTTFKVRIKERQYSGKWQVFEDSDGNGLVIVVL